MSKKANAATTTSRTSPRRAPKEETSKNADDTVGTPATPVTEAPGAAPVNVAEAPIPGGTAPETEPGAGPEVPTAANRPGTDAGASAPATDEKKSASVQIVTRFPTELAARLDRFTDSLRGGRFGLRVSRADAVRILVNEGLAQFEKEQAASART